MEEKTVQRNRAKRLTDSTEEWGRGYWPSHAMAFSHHRPTKSRHRCQAAVRSRVGERKENGETKGERTAGRRPPPHSPFANVAVNPGQVANVAPKTREKKEKQVRGVRMNGVKG